MNTTLNISDILDTSELWRLIEAKRIKRTDHPTLPIYVLNYTDLATYAGEWTQAERVCRGLIVEGETGKIIARGPSKFFNYGEPSAKTYPLDTMVRVTKKEDGSLGIGWWFEVDEDKDPEGHPWYYGFATRGSFTSEQAEHATAMVTYDRGGIYELIPDVLMDYHNGDNGCKRPITDIVEIVYPENRIVLDYGGKDELIGLGAVDNATGLICWRPTNGDCEPWTKADPVMTLAEAIALPIPDDEEGYVLDILDAEGNTIDHLKLKGAEYLRRHKLIFNLTERSLYKALRAGTHHHDVAALPDEWQPWATEVLSGQVSAFYGKLKGIEKDFSLIEHLTDRKEFALAAKDLEHTKFLFLARDGQTERLHDAVWEAVAP